MEDKEFERNLKKVITNEERKHKKKYLRTIETSLYTNNQKKKFNWRIAASILVLIGMGSYFTLFNKSLSNEELYQLHFSPYENVVAPIVRNQIELSNKAEVFSEYEQGKYQKSIEGFDKLTTKDSVDVATINFYKANAYLQLKEFEEAQTLFNKIIENKNNEWRAESFWYLALISIKLNNVDVSVSYLQKLQKQNKKKFKSKEIEDLLNTLN